MSKSHLTIAAAAVLAVGLVASCAARGRALEIHISEVRLGMSATQVVAIMGKPGDDGPCDPARAWAANAPERCARGFLYSDPLAPWVPRYYFVWFGSEGGVIDTAVITSP